MKGNGVVYYERQRSCVLWKAMELCIMKGNVVVHYEGQRSEPCTSLLAKEVEGKVIRKVCIYVHHFWKQTEQNGIELGSFCLNRQPPACLSACLPICLSVSLPPLSPSLQFVPDAALQLPANRTYSSSQQMGPTLPAMRPLSEGDQRLWTHCTAAGITSPAHTVADRR